MQPSTLFEGSEKKLEIIFSPTMEPLRNRKHSLWKKICEKANSHIVSRFSSRFCNSYILSESSLFVWDHRLLMLTCGQTSLIHSIIALLKHFKDSDIELLFYQRKNELFPHNQKSSFMEDIYKIEKKMPGQAYRFGQPHEHHFQIFHSKSDYQEKNQDRTIEILMYDLDDRIKQFFFEAEGSAEVRKRFKLDQLFKNTQIDDHHFSPHGYSLNGLRDKKEYYTIHATPQEPGFYVSFETNIIEEPPKQIIEKILKLFKPTTFDLILFSSNKKIENFSFDLFTQSAYFTKRLECEYEIHFYSFFQSFAYPLPAFQLKHKGG